MRLGVVAKTAIVIEYYLPQKFPKQSENLIPPAPRGRIIPFPAFDSNSVPTLFRLAWLPVFDFGLPNRHKFIFDFMGEDALSSKARFWLRQFDAVSECKACPYPPLSSAVDCHLTVSTFRHKRRPSLGRDPFISTTSGPHVRELQQAVDFSVWHLRCSSCEV
jgi:hypothetical protein